MSADIQLASFMNAYNMRGQHTADRAMTRYKHDPAKMVENNEISTGPGRWALGVPNAYGNAAYVPNVTTINQKWGASHIMTSTKTDVESDLRNIGRPSVRTTCGQYQPEQGAALAAQLIPMPEADLPQTASHLVDPPCTLRGTGINRWEWLCQNPQENVMTPFEHLIDSRHASKDAIYDELVGPAVVAASKIAADRTLICGRPYVEVATPVAKPRGPKDPQTFNDAVPGASQRPSMPPPVARETPTGAAKQGPAKPVMGLNAPSRGGPVFGERERAATGVLLAPPPFTQYIAPH
jgi:hypothetical protein